MASLKRIFETVGHHYEKIVLIVVMIGLVGAAVALVIIVPAKRNGLEEYTTRIIRQPADALGALDLGAEKAVLQRAQSPESLDFTTHHKLLNPVLWQILPGGRLQKIESDKDFGPGALKITAIDPLYLRVELGDATADGYIVHVINEAATRPSEHDKNTIISSGTPGDMFDHVSITGTPPEVQLEFKTNHEAVTLTADKPWQRVAGYTVTLSYPHDPANLIAAEKLRVNDRFMLEGDTYYVFAISENGAVVSSQANNKKTPLTFNPH